MPDCKGLHCRSTVASSFEHCSERKSTCKIGACTQATVHARHPDVKALSTNGSKRVLGTAMEELLLIDLANSSSKLHFMAPQAVLGPQVRVLHSLNSDDMG